MLKVAMQKAGVDTVKLKSMEGRIRDGFKKPGQGRQADESKAELRKSSPEKDKVSSDIQGNRSAEAGNKISIYRALKCTGEGGGWKLQIERERCSVYPAPENGTGVIHLTRALNVLQHLLRFPPLGALFSKGIFHHKVL